MLLCCLDWFCWILNADFLYHSDIVMESGHLLAPRSQSLPLTDCHATESLNDLRLLCHSSCNCRPFRKCYLRKLALKIFRDTKSSNWLILYLYYLFFPEDLLLLSLACCFWIFTYIYTVGRKNATLF